MKRAVFITVFLAVSVFMCGQTYEDSIRYWKDGPLTWEDLNLKQSRDTNMSSLAFVWQFDTDTLRPAWNTVEYALQPATLMIKSTSWHSKDHQTPLALKYDQLFFDLSELYFRKLLTDYERPGNQYTYDTLLDFYTEQLDDRTAIIKEETSSGRDSAMVSHHRKLIDEELDTTSFPDIRKRRVEWGEYIYAGLGTSFLYGAMSAPFPNRYGVTFGLGFRYKRHAIELSGMSTTNSLLADFTTDGITWSKGDRFYYTNMFINYEFVVYDGSTVSVAPLVGIGVRGLTWYYGGTSASKDFVACNSPLVIAGIDTNLKFARRIRSEGLVEHSVCLRPFAARNFGGGGLDGWSFNLGVCYRLGAYSLY